MDIDRLARRVSEQLASRPSRRGIVSAAGKLVAGAGVVLAGLRHPGEAAAQQYKPIPGSCCTSLDANGDGNGDPCPSNNGKCPGDMKKRYQWFCNNNGTRELCLDCYKSGSYTCTVVTTR
jgi:hypothetical protein